MPAVVRRWLEPPYALDGWRIDVANMTGRFRDVDLNRRRRARARPRGRPARRACSSPSTATTSAPTSRPAAGTATMNYAGFLRPVWTWLRGDDLPEELAAPSGASRSALPSLAGAAAVATMRAFRAGVPWRAVAPLLDAARQPRHRPLPHGRRLARAPARRRRAADDDAGRADGLRRRRARPRGRLGRGRAPHDAVGPTRDLGRRRCSTSYRRLIALRRSSDGARARRHPLRARRRRTRSRTCARRRASACSASRAAPTHEPVRLPLALLGCTELETLLRRRRRAARAATAVLPADGPAFHVWRLT